MWSQGQQTAAVARRGLMPQLNTAEVAPAGGAGGRSSSHPNPLIIHSTNVYAALGSEASPVLVAWNAEMALLQQDAGMRSGNSEGSPGLWSGRVLRRLGDCGGSNCWHSAPWQALPPSWASVSPPV